MLTEAQIVYQTAKASLAVLVDGALGRLDRASADQKLRSWGQACLDIADIRLATNGRDAVDWSRAYVIMSNHQSLFDIPVLAVTIPGSLRFVAKKELFRIPLWGQAMRAADIVSIDRQNRRSAIDSLHGAAAILATGIHIWIAPEGTRSLDGRVGPLKKGGFMLALETRTPILPIAISGTRLVRPPHERGIKKGVTVNVRFGATIPVLARSRDELMAEVAAFLAANVG